MAKRYSRRPYRMTPARKAALRKAQLASAKRRKRNRRIAVGAAVGGAAVAAYAGYKFGPQAGSIAGDLKARAPRNVAAAQARARSAVSPLRKHVTRMRNGLTRGKVDGAGPEGASKAPREWKRTSVPMPTSAEIKKIRENAERAERARRPESRQRRQGYNEDGTVRERIVGIPREILRGRKPRRKTIKRAMETHNENIMGMGVEGKNSQQINSILDTMVAEKQIAPDRRRRRRRGTAKKRRGAAKKRKLTIEEQAMSQWDKDFGG